MMPPKIVFWSLATINFDIEKQQIICANYIIKQTPHESTNLGSWTVLVIVIAD
jgi:hypothetical protein